MKNRTRIILILVIMIAALAGFSAAEGSFAAQKTCTGEHDFKVTIVTRATADKEGLRKYECRVCGLKKEEKIPATGHVWGEWQTVKDATTSADGLKSRVCQKNGDHVQYKTVSKLEETSTRKLPTIRDMSETTITVIHDPEPEMEEEPEESLPEEEEEELEEEITAEPDNDPSGVGGFSGSTYENEQPEPEHVPLGAADVAIIGANGFAALYFLILLLPMFRVWLWIRKKKHEAEGEG